MNPIASFATSAVAWQNFYLLCGTAAATLIGLMFVAVTFGASLVTPKNAESARSFLDPVYTHFMQVLVTGCLLIIPTMFPGLLGGLLIAIGALRLLALVRVFRHMKQAQRTHNDIELTDWLMGIVVPLLSYLLLAASGAGFIANFSASFGLLAGVTIATLLNGAFGAWELLVWLAMTRARANNELTPEGKQSGQSG